MCLAIGPICNSEKSALGRLWWRIASQPHYLFTFSTVVHATIYLILLLSNQLAFDAHIILSSIFVFYGLVGFSILGFLLTQFPVWFKTSAINYLSYAISYNFAFIGLLLIEVGLVFSYVWGLVGGLMLLMAWLLAVRAIHWSYSWGLGSRQGISKLLMWLLHVGLLLMLGGLLIEFLQIEFFSSSFILLSACTSVSLLALFSFLLFVKQKQVA